MKIRSVKFNFFMNALTTVINFLFPLITFPYVSRVLTPLGYGGAEFALNTAQIFALVALLGINTYGLRECAKVRDNNSKQAKVFQELFLIIVFWTLLVTLFYYGFIFLMPEHFNNINIFLIAGSMIPLTALGLQWFMAANEQYAFMTIRNIAIKVIILIGMFLFVQSEEDVWVWVVLSILATGLVSFTNCIFAFKHIKFSNWKDLHLKKHIKPLLTFFLMVASISIYTTLDSVMLGFMANDTQVGYYAIAVKIKNVFTAIVASLANVIIPRVSYSLASGDKQSYYKLINISVHAGILYAGFTTFVGIFFAEPIILLLAGDSYRDAVAILVAIMPAVAFISFTQITALEILTPQNKENLLSLTYFIAGITDIVLNIILIPIWHGLGAAIATTIAEFLVFILQFTIISKQEKLQPYLKDVSRLIPGLLISIACLFAGRLIFGVSLFSAICVTFSAFCILIVILFICKEPLVLQIHKELHIKIQGIFSKL